MAKKGRRAGLFIGGVLFGLIRGIFFKNKYWGSFMNFVTIWNNICLYEGEIFYTITGKPYRYVVYEDYIMIENIKGSRIKKESIKKALLIDNPSPSKINIENIRGPSYVYGIITDRRILS